MSTHIETSRPVLPMTENTKQARPATPAASGSPEAVGTTPLRGPTRVAIVGAGFIADFHFEILRETPDVEIVCVCDSNLERARSAAQRHGVPKAVASLEEVAQLGVQVAHVLVPPALHVAVAGELLRLGVGVFAEKPLALSTEEACQLAELAAEGGIPLGVNQNSVFHPAFAALLQRVQAGEIGRVEHVQITLSVPLRQLDAGDFSHWMFRSPRNIVFEQAPHPFAQLHALIGRVREADTSLLSTRELQPGQPFHERWLISARAERGTAEVYLAFGQPFTRSTIQVLGSDGSLEVDLWNNLLCGEEKTIWLDFWNSFLAGWRRGKSQKRWARTTLKDYLAFTLGMGPRRDAFFAGMEGSIRAFHAALHEGRPLPVDGATGTAILEWCEAVTEGVAGDPVREPELPEPGPARPGEIALLGGTGFIGRRTIARLLAEDRPVTCIVRRAHSLPVQITEAAADGRLRLVRGSLEDREGMAAAVAGAETVVQLATGNGPTWEAVERSMVQGSVDLAEACLAAGVKRYVYVSSTASLYLGEDAGREVGDEVGVDPKPEARSLYARGKIAAERALEALRDERGLPLVVVRPAVVLGPGSPLQHSGLGLWVRDNHCVGWGPGDNPLPVVFVDDVAEALVRVVAHEGAELDGKALNLAADVPLTARQIVDELRRATGRRLDFHPRSLGLSQVMEIGKWIVKKAGRRPGAVFPSWRDLKSRALVPKLTCEIAREVLDWKPVEDPERFLDVAAHGRPSP